MGEWDKRDRVAAILAAAPAWARLALTSSDPRLRADGADALSVFLLARIAEPQGGDDADQLVLPIAG